MHCYSLTQSETLQYADAQIACTAYHPDGLLAAPLNADIQATLLILIIINADQCRQLHAFCHNFNDLLIIFWPH